MCMAKYVRNTEMLQRRFVMCVCDALGSSWEIENNSICHRDNSCSRGLITTVENNNCWKISCRTYLTFSGGSRADRATRESHVQVLILQFQTLKLIACLWSSLVHWVFGNRNNPININPMINLPVASNSSRFYLKADHSHMVQSTCHSHERWLKQLCRPLVEGSSRGNKPSSNMSYCAKQFFCLNMPCF